MIGALPTLLVEEVKRKIKRRAAGEYGSIELNAVHGQALRFGRYVFHVVPAIESTVKSEWRQRFDKQ